MKVIIGKPEEIAAYELALKDGEKKFIPEDSNGNSLPGKSILKELNQEVNAANITSST